MLRTLVDYFTEHDLAAVIVPDTSALLSRPDLSEWSMSVRSLMLISDTVHNELDNLKTQTDKAGESTARAKASRDINSQLEALTRSSSMAQIADGLYVAIVPVNLTDRLPNYIPPVGLNLRGSNDQKANNDHRVAVIADFARVLFRVRASVLITGDKNQAIAASYSQISRYCYTGECDDEDMRIVADLLRELGSSEEGVDPHSGVDPSATRLVDATSLGDSALVGRERELAELGAALVSITSSEPPVGDSRKLLLLAGDSGAGKSALAHAAIELCRRTQTSVEVFSVACEPFHEGMSFFPIREVVRQATNGRPLHSVVADYYGAASSQAAIAALADQQEGEPGQRRDALIVTFANILCGRFSRTSSDRAHASPIVVFFDDLELVDVGTVDALLCLVSRLGEGPIAIVGAYRSDLLPEGAARIHPLARLMREARRDGVLKLIRVGSLKEDAIPALVATQLRGPCDLPYGFYSRLFVETEGNPLFIRETLRALQAPSQISTTPPLRRVNGIWEITADVSEWGIPATVEDAILSRLANLAPMERTDLEVAAVIGRRFAFEVMRALSEASETALLGHLESFVNFDIIREVEHSDETFEFSHGKIRDVLLQAMSNIRRRRVHGHVADVLMGLSPDALSRMSEVGSGNWGALIGVHLFEAGRHEEAIPKLLDAARSEMSLNNAQVAVAHFDRALAAHERAELPRGERVSVIRLKRAEALKLANEYDAAQEALKDLAQLRTEPDVSNWALNHLGDIQLLRGELNRALESYSSCERAAREAGDEALIVEVCADLAELHCREAEHWAGLDPDKAKQHQEQYAKYLIEEMAMATKLADAQALARAFRNVAKRHRAAGELTEAVEYYRRAISLTDDRIASHQYLIPFAKALRLVGGHAEAMSQVLRVLEWSRLRGSRRSEAIARQYRALLWLEAAIRGEEVVGANIEDELLTAHRLHQAVGFAQGRRETEVILGELALFRDDVEEATRYFARSLDEERMGEQAIPAVAAQLRANGEIMRSERLMSIGGTPKPRS